MKRPHSIKVLQYFVNILQFFVKFLIGLGKNLLYELMQDKQCYKNDTLIQIKFKSKANLFFYFSSNFCTLFPNLS